MGSSSAVERKPLELDVASSNLASPAKRAYSVTVAHHSVEVIDTGSNPGTPST